MTLTRLLIPTLLLTLASPVMAKDWCFGKTSRDKESGLCTGKGWVVVKRQPSKERVHCYLRSQKGTKDTLYITPHNIVFMRKGIKFPADAKPTITVDKQPAIAPNLIAAGEGLEFSNPKTISTLVGEFKAGYNAVVNIGSDKYRYTLIGFTKAYNHFNRLCQKAQN